MRFIETSLVTRAVAEPLDDGTYRSLQTALLLRPELGHLGQQPAQVSLGAARAG